LKKKKEKRDDKTRIREDDLKKNGAKKRKIEKEEMK